MKTKNAESLPSGVPRTQRPAPLGDVPPPALLGPEHLLPRPGQEDWGEAGAGAAGTQGPASSPVGAQAPLLPAAHTRATQIPAPAPQRVRKTEASNKTPSAPK